MERIEELKLRGWTSLNKEERDEFRKLVKQQEDISVEERKRRLEEKRNMVTLSRADLDAAIKEGIEQYKLAFRGDSPEGLDEAIKMGQWMKAREETKVTPTAKLRIYRENGLAEPGLIIDWRFKENAFNEISRRYDTPIYQIRVLYNDSVKEYDMPLVKMVEINEYETVDIIEQKVEELELVQGVGRRAYSEKGYNFSSPSFFGTAGKQPGDSFKYIVKKKEIKCKIRRPDGRLLDISADRLNQ